MFSWFQALLPLAGVFLMAAFYFFVSQSGSSKLMAIPMVAMSGFSALGSIIGRRAQIKRHKKEVAEKEAAYAAALKQKRAELEHLRQEQQRIRTDVDPDLATLLARARHRDRLWERRPEDDDFLNVRLGVGNLPSTVTVSAPHPDMPDPRLQEAHAIEAEYATVPNVPVTASLRSGPLGVAGPLPHRTGVACALICNIVFHHSPDEVHLLAIYSPERTADWAWLKWLPHTYALDETERHYLANDTFSAEEVLRGLLEELHHRRNRLDGMQQGGRKPEWPWLVVLVENYALVREDPAIHLLLSREGRELNVTALILVDHKSEVPGGCAGIVECQPDGHLKYAIAGSPRSALTCRSDHANAVLGEQLARSLAPLRVHTLKPDTDLPTQVRLLDLMGIKDITAYDVVGNWQRRSSDQYLKVPIGVRRGNQEMVLDLSHTGHGPHGLIAGTTGSGKSELLQTLVLSLALKHHPHDVGFVLVDFKGGGAFSDLAALPHTLGIVTNISGNLAERALVALEAEIKRREHLLVNEAGVNDIGMYQQLYWQGKVKQPLPRIIIIIDEFAELVTDYPDFMDGLIRVARVGRALGIHLILATQSPAGVVRQQIWDNAKFRICLRVESREASMAMLHRPEAANLPRMPGRGYLQVGTDDVFELFQVARVAGPYHAQGDTDRLQRKREERIVIAEVSPLGRRNVLFDSGKAQKRKPAGPTDIEMVVPVLVNAAKRLNIAKLPSPWPEPLPDHIPLPDLLLREKYAGWNGHTWVFDRPAIIPPPPPPRYCYACGTSLRPGARYCAACGAPVQDRCRYCGSPLRPGARFCGSCGTEVAAPPAPAPPPPPRPPNLPNRPWLGAMLGLLDDPANQRQLPLLFELNQQDGHVILVGAPGSGKSIWVRTLITSLARTHTPDELHFYLLEFGRQALKTFERLPHVGGVFTPLDDERVRRLFLRLIDSLDERRKLCDQARVDSLVRLRELQPGEAPPAIVVVITGFAEFRKSFENEMPQLIRLLREGGPYGIHVVLVGDCAGDIPSAINSVIARRFTLRLADIDEYSIVLGMRPKLSKGQKIPPGRGWYGRPPLEFQTASPGNERDESAQIAEVERIVEEMNVAWQGPRPEPVETLRAVIPLHEVLSRVPAPPFPPPQPQTAVPLGLDSVRLRPVLVDLVADGPNFIVASTPQGGKTTLLLTWALALAELNSPQQVQFVLISGRRNSLRPLEGMPHLLSLCRTPKDFRQDGVLDRLLAEIRRRETLLSENLSHVGELSHIVVMFDDYDEFFNTVGGEKEVESGLSILAGRGRDVNIHTIVTGPLPNMGVGFSDPLVKQLKIERSGFLLRVLDAGDQNPLNLRIRASEIQQMPPGRGYVVRRGAGEMLQVATPGDSKEIASRVARLQQRWAHAGVGPASWPEVEV